QSGTFRPPWREASGGAAAAAPPPGEADQQSQQPGGRRAEGRYRTHFARLAATRAVVRRKRGRAEAVDVHVAAMRAERAVGGDHRELDPVADRVGRQYRVDVLELEVLPVAGALQEVDA